MANSFTDIIAWREAHDFVLRVYGVTKMFPNEEKFGLTSQFQRAAVSIAANISEDYRKLSKVDKLKFMNIAQESLEECRYYIILSHDLGYINEDKYLELNTQIEKTSWFLNAYVKGIVENHALQKEQDAQS
ncbi:four helix bundle protein [Prevotella sp. S7 MS 2]|uniref:four helix bundle protein n=1 Tax=Prevotella sp. S7 MS 2 TaxID=1287488 RepID=UPI0005147D3C|nr:four helix bundle protein [Prevotella sp. S7 MS 2]KGI59429.1 30S ribosomal protein S23 [Prevotella sp. S7 MS 2]